jgi:hypothetical protein
VDESAGARVDPHVIHLATLDAKENQVAGGQCIERNRAGRKPLRFSRARNFEPSTFVHVDRKSTAVESLQIRASEVIGNANELSRTVCDGSPSVFRHARYAAARGKQQRCKDRQRIPDPAMCRMPGRAAIDEHGSDWLLASRAIREA